MFDTDFTLLLGVRHPLVCAGMGSDISDGELAGRVSEAGALGVIGASWPGPDDIGEMVSRTREITSNPIGINLLLFGNDDLLPVTLKARPAVLSTA
jgi:NADH:quinone reductase (non-electrogenic)